MTISAVIPAFNARAYVGGAIESVLAQSRRPDEIIVIDDGSTDGTADVVRRYADKVRLIVQAGEGASAARNAGINAAAGEWIAFLDADDQWLAGRLAAQCEYLEKYPRLVWTSANFYRRRCGRNHRRYADLAGARLENVRKILAERGFFGSYFDAHAAGAAGYTGTMLIRRDVLLDAGLFLPGQKRMNDVDMWLRIAYPGRPMGYITEPLAIYHTDVAGSIVKTHTDAGFVCEFIDRHIELSGRAGVQDEFRAMAARMIGYWMKILLGQKQGREIRYILDRYKELLSRHFCRTMRINSYIPCAATAYEKIKQFVKSLA